MIGLTLKFEMFSDVQGKTRFRLVAGNGEIVATSEAYESKQACKDTILTIQKRAPQAQISDLT